MSPTDDQPGSTPNNDASQIPKQEQLVIPPIDFDAILTIPLAGVRKEFGGSSVGSSVETLNEEEAAATA
jgi:hypothetical protein